MDDVKLSVISSILNFLRGEFHAGYLDPENAEGLEVAIHCLENIYNVSSVRRSNEPSLLEIYKYYYENSIHHRSDATEEEKVEGERFKVEGNAAMSAGQYLEALQLYSRAIECDPKNAVYYCNRAAAKSKLNDHAAAIRDCNIALELDPKYSKAYGRLGLAYCGLESYVYALENYKKAYDLEPDNVGYRRNLELAQQKVADLCCLNLEPHSHSETNISSTGGPNLGAHISDNESGVPPNRGPAQLPLDINMLLGNPQLVNIASQMLADPTMQNMMSSIINQESGTGMQALLQAGQNLARHMQSENPNFFNQLRQSFNPNNDPSGSGGMGGNIGGGDSEPSSSHDKKN
ncbi:small glutamine-rich tetratricopeptide repeat-containing protein beta [Halyomorpha halys]|uniref:small glutamine-rich tetratricopeptide repeat-containing protein beta n=1 Tax=Halyomorpha halys TaxID=286706 RepID=UPI0006D524B4|nr:small glutamine-rich tetratricopeptide repeat-containing protein beta [Halyomorpha halys]